MIEGDWKPRPLACETLSRLRGNYVISFSRFPGLAADLLAALGDLPLNVKFRKVE